MRALVNKLTALSYRYKEDVSQYLSLVNQISDPLVFETLFLFCSELYRLPDIALLMEVNLKRLNFKRAQTISDQVDVLEKRK